MFIPVVGESLKKPSQGWNVLGAQAVSFYGRGRLSEDVDLTVLLGGMAHDQDLEREDAQTFWFSYQF